ncbi:cache domain-containing protein [Sinorhizobium sp. RAC02]|uniref:sensor histidine kinase n=1 Tax=Sinorhizobium sp. RAC02 TaxID=1842534 RepID=UPI00083CD44E|nr:cache domain-containing protein [Sinorhizobium sp. RAC02]AOF90685.1 HAMP domain protein [Sinorhizobium sp. RAC02]
MPDSKPSGTIRPARSVRYRLLAIALLPMLVILPLLLGVTVYRWNEKFDATLISKVNGDLTIAHQYLAHILDNTGEHITALGASARFRDVATDGVALKTLLEESRARLELDFLYVMAPDGRLVASVTEETAGALRTDWPVIRDALAGKPATGIDIFDNADLETLSPDLAARAKLPLVQTPNAVPTERTEEGRGMVVQSASPVILGDGGNAVLVGGILLNQNLVFIDTINDLVYREASLPEGSQGTATLFLDDVRISTNVRLFEGRRALGTRVSAAVRSAVLGEGRTWLDSAFVVNDWYISAYEPITDSHGKRVGMLYVGFLEAPFTAAKYQTVLTIVAAFFAITAASVPIFLRWARGIFEPLERVDATIARVESGDLGARTGPVDSQDEIGRVAVHLDDLLNQLEQNDQELRRWNEELNARVDERTRELQLANRQLEATTKQLILSEKLAAIGEITAGVAHEINNPIAVMQGNLEVIRSVVGDRAELAKVEFQLLDEQIQRISQIVTKLLQFAKPEEFAGFVDRHAPGMAVADCLPLVQHLLARAAIEVRLENTTERLVLMNRTELQQVVVNLVVNAIHAMPDGGRLTVVTRDQDREERPGIELVVSDTGVGMDPDLAAKIFDPFFTTKRQEGTGLGLSISQTLVTRQGGAISVASRPGEGATFTVWLPEAD